MADFAQPDYAHLAARLQDRRRALVAEIRTAMEDGEGEHSAFLREQYDSLDPHDDRALGDWVRDVVLARYDRGTAELHEIEAALRRMSEGTYGECIDCGQPIARARLEANPSAARCIDCQQRAEARQGTIKPA